jgi:arginine repressor
MLQTKISKITEHITIYNLRKRFKDQVYRLSDDRKPIWNGEQRIKQTKQVKYEPVQSLICLRRKMKT